LRRVITASLVATALLLWAKQQSEFRAPGETVMTASLDPTNPPSTLAEFLTARASKDLPVELPQPPSQASLSFVHQEQPPAAAAINLPKELPQLPRLDSPPVVAAPPQAPIPPPAIPEATFRAAGKDAAEDVPVRPKIIPLVENTMFTAGKAATADVRGNLGPASVVTSEVVADWLKDRCGL